MHIIAPTTESINRAADIIRAGGIVGMPTETVYGLAADATNAAAVARVFSAKGRPAFNPLIMHCSDATMAGQLGIFDMRADALAARFWPGPLTIIVPKAPDGGVCYLATAGLSTIALRVPSHPAARALITACGKPLAAPSANVSGTISPTSAAHVAQSLGDHVDMILAGGASAIGLESTVIDLSSGAPVMLRPGAISAEDIEYVMNEKVLIDTGTDSAPRAPGRTLRHYAPSVPLRLRAIDVMPGEALLGFGSLKFMSVRGHGGVKEIPEDSIKNLSESGDLHEAAANLFAMLRALDDPRHSAIAVMDIPATGLGIAINDRLRRAVEQ